MLDIQKLRKDYTAHTLELEGVSAEPLAQFRAWFEQAVEAQVPEPNAMTLATCTPEGKPSARIVLLKGVEEEGFVFFTNYNSRKGRELEQNPRAALVFLWHELQRQVRVEGTVKKISPEASTLYFQSRPKGSQIGAWASPQSSPIVSRSILEQKAEDLAGQYAAVPHLPRPHYWGGYALTPTSVEFWQGRSSRLHDRIRYRLEGNGAWKAERLAP
ncbi:MAG: pyridoxamine 5'-phosphate oxidase [Lewinellaceae bacterium]|nr:pyridoxamine 5'-phosphate oxidase [Phaeodactylibacter sp.]MCB9041641.1 pyridoxamine 5'-phosphate oxidase [Lewinellaceae bacterium]